MASETERAWLSGIWDGEGSVSSFVRSETNVGPSIQLSMTCKSTVDRIIEILGKIGVIATGYTYQEKQNHHKHSHHIRVPRAQDALTMGRALLPYSVTKRRMWELVIEMCQLKVARRRVMPDGRLARGGAAIYPITPREFEIAHELRALNYRKKPGEVWADGEREDGYQSQSLTEAKGG